MALMWNRTVDWDADDWRRAAACRNTEPDLFFPVGTTGPAVDQIDAAKRTNSEEADGRVIVGVKVGEQISAFRYAAGSLKAESEIEGQRPGHAIVVLHESERVE